VVREVETLKDVAAASGVSRATVSFVLNDTPNQSISKSTRARVLAVVRDLGYKPHGIARALREGTSRIVVLYIGSGLEGNYSRSFIRGLDEELAANDNVLVVRHGRTDVETAQQVLDAINPRAVLHFAEAYRTGHELEDRGGGWRDGLAAHAGLQIGYLAERGHTRIALALPGAEAPLREIREQFSRQAAQALGLPSPVTLVVPRPRQAGTAAVEQFRRAAPGGHRDRRLRRRRRAACPDRPARPRPGPVRDPARHQRRAAAPGHPDTASRRR
jgi:DNA-binding LacI/PurR family transcriptional regulator